jgi:hypothetical protein
MIRCSQERAGIMARQLQFPGETWTGLLALVGF